MVERNVMKNRNINYAKQYNDPKKEERKDTSEEALEETHISNEETIEIEPIVKMAIVDIEKNQTLNLREEKSLESNIITVLSNGETVVINEMFGDWTYVSTEASATGYVMTKYLKFI